MLVMRILTTCMPMLTDSMLDLSLLDCIFSHMACRRIFNFAMVGRNVLCDPHPLLREHYQGARPGERKQTSPIWGGVLGFNSHFEYHHH